MHHIKNTSETTQIFWASGDDGLKRLHRLKPGESVDANIDPRQPRFAKGGAFALSAPRKAAEPKPQAKPEA